jgi:biotin carboxylase
MTAGRLLHVLGGGPWQTPTIRRARELGYRVLVTDMFAERPGYEWSDLHETVDVTNLDATLDAARRHRIDGVLCDSTDVGVPTSAWVAERLGLPGIGYEIALNFTHKARMRECIDRAGISQVRFGAAGSPATLDAVAQRIGLPMVVKPVDNQSGRGVSVVHNAALLPAAWETAAAHSRIRQVIGEQYIAGSELIVDGFVLDGRVSLLGIAAKKPYPDNPTVCSRIAYLSGESFGLMEQRVGPVTKATIGAMGLRNGIFHAEFMLCGERTIPLDIAARGGGVMIYGRALPHVCGVDVMRAMIHVAMGEPVHLEPLARRRGACIEFLRMPEGRVSRVIGADAAAAVPGIAALHFNLGPGDIVGPLRHKDDRPGFIVALGDSTEAAVASAQRAKALLAVVIGEGGPQVPVY